MKECSQTLRHSALRLRTQLNRYSVNIPGEKSCAEIPHSTTYNFNEINPQIGECSNNIVKSLTRLDLPLEHKLSTGEVPTKRERPLTSKISHRRSKRNS